MCWEENILGTYIVGNKLLISFEKDYWAIDVFMTSREVRKAYFERILDRLRHEFPGNSRMKLAQISVGIGNILALGSCVESSRD